MTDGYNLAVPTVGENIRRLRRQADLTQQDLAGRLRIKQATLSRLERKTANPDVLTIIRVANALRVTVGDILADVEGEKWAELRQTYKEVLLMGQSAGIDSSVDLSKIPSPKPTITQSSSSGDTIMSNKATFDTVSDLVEKMPARARERFVRHMFVEAIRTLEREVRPRKLPPKRRAG